MDQEKTYKWIQVRLRDLHSGTISEADRLRLDEMAKTDPFIQDALEGYGAHSNHDHSALLNLLSQRIQNKSASKRAKLMPLSRGWVLQAIAASLVLILATWAVIYYVDKSDDVVLVTAEGTGTESGERITEVVLTQPDSSADDIAASTETSVDELTSEPPGLRANAQARMKDVAKTEAEAKDGLITNAKVKETDSYTFVDVPASASSGAVSEDHVQPAAPKQTVTETQSSDVDASKTSIRNEGYYANQMNPDLLAQRVIGKVLAENGEPLIGVNLSISNTNLGTITDLKGRFELYLPSQQSIVDVTYSGYVDAIIQLKQGDEDVVITLPEKNISLDEVIVSTTHAKVQTQNVPAERAYTPTRAKESNTSFADYLRKNTRIPIQENLNATAKEVMIEFTVSTKGRPEQIRVIRSSNQKEYDDEAVWLIRKGPEWECEMGLYPCTARYTIYFQ